VTLVRTEKGEYRAWWAAQVQPTVLHTKNQPGLMGSPPNQFSASASRTSAPINPFGSTYGRPRLYCVQVYPSHFLCQARILASRSPRSESPRLGTDQGRTVLPFFTSQHAGPALVQGSTKKTSPGTMAGAWIRFSMEFLPITLSEMLTPPDRATWPNRLRQHKSCRIG
jgi:hypothetical protein